MRGRARPLYNDRLVFGYVLQPRAFYVHHVAFYCGNGGWRSRGSDLIRLTRAPDRPI